MFLKANNLVSAGNVLVIYSFAANETIRKRDFFLSNTNLTRLMGQNIFKLF